MNADTSPIVELTPRIERAGFRLTRLEVLNWGTFDNRVWSLDARGDNTLLTGDIGSGKSTLVDAITTLLVPPAKLAYNKAAGAETKERTLRSYVLGHYKATRSDEGSSARAVALRGRNDYSVVLARFENVGLDETVTLAQVFWSKDTEGQPARMYVVADEALSITKNFSDFGTEIAALRRRLRRTGFEVSDSFPPYGAALRRRFGIDNEQALELFHQTVSMKSVGNLTDFVRQHMLEPAPMAPRITALLGHFDDLNRAHEAVVRARAQIERLEPLVADCDRHAELASEVESLRACREALQPWFARAKGSLLEKRLEKLAAEIARLDERMASLQDEKATRQRTRDGLLRAIADNGGDRIQRLKEEEEQLRRDMHERQTRASRYDELAQAAGLAPASSPESFRDNRVAIDKQLPEIDEQHATVQNAHTDAVVEFRGLRIQHDEVERELASLRQRASNIPARMLELRAVLRDALGVAEEALPFAGELLQVREDERDWEGAIERLLHNFGLSLLVPDAHYAGVAAWVDRTHLGGRLVYYRVRQVRTAEYAAAVPASLVRKLAVKPDSGFYGWLESELARRFNYVCCDTLEEFRREQRAITRAGQTRGGERHEKDDRHRIDDRSRYVLGWSNEAKVAEFERQRHDLESRIQHVGRRIAETEARLSELANHRDRLKALAFYETFRDLEWQPLATQIQALGEERERLEAGSDVLRELQTQLAGVDAALETVEETLTGLSGDVGSARNKESEATRLRDECAAVLAQTPDPALQALDAMDGTIHEAMGDRTLTVEACDNRERDVRDAIQKRIDAEEKKIQRLVEKIVQAMQAYRAGYPAETREADASVAAAGEYRTMLERLRGDDLPRFEKRFKELLNENTIREVANFQSQLLRERQTIQERIDTINRSLREIDYNPGRYMALEPEVTTDVEIREFQHDLRACTEGALTGSEDDAYSEAKFLQVKRIIERFRGREGTTDLDKRWTAKVTDVRTWFSFAASERWRETDQEHEHYTDSGGKSGGQKEKLAYTVLAASLAYQFGLEWGAPRSRSFRFVVIDEAFGRGSDESTRYGLELFERLQLQLLIVTPLQKIHVIEPHVASVGFVHNEDGRRSMVRNLTIEQYRAEQAARTA